MMMAAIVRALCLYACYGAVDRSKMEEDLVKISKTWTARHGGTA